MDVYSGAGGAEATEPPLVSFSQRTEGSGHFRAASAGVLRLSCCVQLRGSDRIVVGSWDASLSVYSVGHGQLCGTPLHDI